jgi:hypothetical protein
MENNTTRRRGIVLSLSGIEYIVYTCVALAILIVACMAILELL